MRGRGGNKLACCFVGRFYIQGFIHTVRSDICPEKTVKRKTLYSAHSNLALSEVASATQESQSLNIKRSDVGQHSVSVLHLLGTRQTMLELCQRMIEGAEQKGLSKMEFSLVLLLSCATAFRVFRVSPATKTAFITRTSGLPAFQALMFSPQHTIARNTVAGQHG